MLDTNVWSVLPKAAMDRKVADWIAGQMEHAWLSVVVIAEIRSGIENPTAAAKRDVLERWLADLLVLCADRTLDFDTAAAQIFGTLLARRKLAKQETKLLDLQLAAQALSRDCPVATRNTRDFEWTGVRVIDPWQA